MEDLTTSYAQAGKRLTSRLGDVFRQIGRVVVPVIVLGSDEADASRVTFALRSGVIAAAVGQFGAHCIEAGTRDLVATFRVLQLGTATHASVFVSALPPSLPQTAVSVAIPSQWCPAQLGTPTAQVRSGTQTVIGGAFTPRLVVGQIFGPFVLRAGLQACVVSDTSNSLFEAQVEWREL